MQIQIENFQNNPEANTLVVVLHGLSGSPARMRDVTEAAHEAFKIKGEAVATYTPKLAHSSLLSLTQPKRIASDLLAQIDSLMQDYGFGRLIIVGHSMGSLLARKLVVLAHGEQPRAPFEEGLEKWREPRPWANSIRRIVFTAGILRGWNKHTAQGALTAGLWSIGELIGDLIVNGRWTSLQIRFGAPFVVQTRLQWLALMKNETAPDLTTIQLLGSVDNQVAPEDTIDFVAGEAAQGFVMLQLPETGHTNAIEFANTQVGQERRKCLQSALTETPTALRKHEYHIPASYVTNGTSPDADIDVTDVVFVIHGIRDHGYWTQKIAHRVMAEADKASRVARSMTLSYGYLAMGPFLLPWVRREKVRWLMDRYADCVARYPNADIHYVGHSNGTYLAARALTDYPAANFKKVVFAGSVVRSDYDWGKTQVDSVMNYVASGDWVVAIFPNGLSPWRAFDLGGAGHNGFRQIPKKKGEGSRIMSVPIRSDDTGTLHQIDYVTGGHGAGIRESQWDDIARFVISGSLPGPQNPDFTGRQATWVWAAGRLPPLAISLIVLIVFGLLSTLIVLAGLWGTARSGSILGGITASALAFVGLSWVVRVVLTRL